MKRGGLLIALFAAWAVEWICGFTIGVSAIDGAIGLTLLAGYGYFVINSRRQLSRTVHASTWMLAIVAVAIARAVWAGWWYRGNGLIIAIERVSPPARELAAREGVNNAVVDAIATSFAIGFGYGFVGAIEAVLAAVFGWIGDLVHGDRTPARVGFVPRLAVVALHLPVYAVLSMIGLGALAGLAAGFGQGAHADVPRALLVAVVAVGLACCALATVHVLCLRALRDGGLLARAFLAGTGVLAAVGLAIAAWPSPKAIAVAVLWCGVQLAAIRWARPTG
jgi:hypothetical protein